MGKGGEDACLEHGHSIMHVILYTYILIESKKGDLSVWELARHNVNICSKEFGRVLIDRIGQVVDTKLRDEQAGFRKGRSTVEQIFVLRNIVEWQSTLYITFVDFEKAFDSVHRESLYWQVMEYHLR